MIIAAPSRSHQAPLLAGGLFGLVAAGTAATLAVWHADTLPEAVARPAALVFFLLIVPVEVLIHEAGHFAVAKLLGWRVALISWGAFTLRLQPLTLSFGAPAFGSTAAGAVVAVPPPGRDSNAAWALLFAGGPLANGLLAAAAMVASFGAPSETPRALMVVTAVISALSGLYNLIPRGGSDGAQLVNVLRYGNGDWRGALARLIEQSLHGVRPRDWPPAIIAVVERLALWSDAPDLQLAVYAYRLDRGEIAAARNALARAFADERVLTELAFSAAWFDRDAATARTYLAGTGSWRIHAQTCYWRAAAAMAAVAGDRAEAGEAIRKGRILVAEGPYATRFDAEWFDRIAAEL
jgi:hypothetical protein